MHEKLMPFPVINVRTFSNNVVKTTLLPAFNIPQPQITSLSEVVSCVQQNITRWLEGTTPNATLSLFCIILS